MTFEKLKISYDLPFNNGIRSYIDLDKIFLDNDKGESLSLECFLYSLTNLVQQLERDVLNLKKNSGGV